MAESFELLMNIQVVSRHLHAQHEETKSKTTRNKFQSNCGYFGAKNPLKSKLLGIIVQHQLELVDSPCARLLLLWNRTDLNPESTLKRCLQATDIQSRGGSGIDISLLSS